jgi:hypothetical protein
MSTLTVQPATGSNPANTLDPPIPLHREAAWLPRQWCRRRNATSLGSGGGVLAELVPAPGLVRLGPMPVS